MLWKLLHSKTKLNLEKLLRSSDEKKVENVLNIYKEAGVDEWALQLKNKYLDAALNHLEDYSCSF